MSREEKLTIWLSLTVLSACLPMMAIAGSPVDASHETQLTHDGFLKRDPVLWPGGKELFYTVEAKTGHMRIVRMNLETGEVFFEITARSYNNLLCVEWMSELRSPAGVRPR